MISRWKIRKISVPRLFWAGVLILLCLPAKVIAQDTQFSYQRLAPLLLNPALAGEEGKYRANLNYRSQWKSLGTPINTIAASFDMSLNPNKKSRRNSGKFGLGANFISDQPGSNGSRINAVNTSVAYRVALTQKSYLGAGLNIGYEQRTWNPANGKWGSQFDGFEYNPNLSSGEAIATDSESHLDLGTGLTYHLALYKKRKQKLGVEVSAGLAAWHLGRIQLSEAQYLSSELNPRYSSFLRVQFPIAERFGLVPFVNAHIQGGSEQYLFGSDLKVVLNADDSFIGDENPMILSAGIACRWKNAIIARSFFQWSDYALGLAYDFNYGKINEYSSGKGGFEMAFRWMVFQE